jgi:hypothetical protein
LATIGVLAGCQPTSDPAESTEAVAEETVQVLNVELHRGATSTIDVSLGGQQAHAWTTLAADETTGRLFVMTDAMPTEITDDEATPVLDPETPPQIAYGPDGTLYLTYSAAADLNNKWSSMAIRFTASRDGGTTWSMPRSVGMGDPFGGYRNDHEMHIAQDGKIYVAWLDSRYAPADESAIHVLMSHSVDGGTTWTEPVLVDPDPSCECCRVALASDADGRVYIAWRKILPGGIRDIVLARSDDQGTTWSTPVRIHADNWEMDYCPDAGPSVLADNKGQLHVAWWTGKPSAAGVRYVQSTDGGLSFGAPVSMKTDSLSKASHVQLAVDGAGQVAVVWDDGTLQMPRIALRTSHDGGATFSPLSYLSPSGPAAVYPAAAFAGDRLAIVWHQRGAEGTTARLPEEGAIWQPYTIDTRPQLVVHHATLP